MNSKHTLAKIQSDLDEIVHIFNQKFGKLSDEQISWKPTEESWSVAECLQHLNLANGFYVKQLGKVFETLEKSKFPAKETFELSFNGKIFINYLVDPKRKYKFSAPKQSRPRPNLDILKVKTRFLEIINSLKILISDSENLNLETIKLTSPFTNLVKFRLGDAYILSARHTKRHFNQAIAVMEMNEFPKK